MNPSTEKLKDYLKKLGFDADISHLYLALYEHGPQSISELSRSSKIERTRIYRLLGELKKSALIEADTHYKRTLYRAAPINNLRVTLAEQEQRVKSLQTELESLEQLLPTNTLTSPMTRVQFFQGADGVKQMLWNQTKAKSDVLAILYKNMQLDTGNSFFDRWIQRRNDSNVRSRGLIGDDFIASQKKWYQKNHQHRMQNWQPRYIEPEIFPITHNVVIYDDIVSFYNWKDNEIFGIEIQNQQIATMHRYFFKAYWQIAKPVDDITGKAK